MLSCEDECIDRICLQKMDYAQHTTPFLNVKNLNKISDIMAEKQKLQAPSGIAGLVRYEECEESLIKMKPIHVVGIVIALIATEVILFLMVPV